MPRPQIHVLRLPGAAAPAPATPFADAHAVYFGGPIISNVHIVQVLYGTGAYLPNIAGTATPTMGQFYTDVTQSPYFDMLNEYSTAGVLASDGTPGTSQTLGHGFFDGLFTITPSAANNGATITDAQIQAELLAQVTAGNLPAPVFDAAGNTNTLYMIFFPPGKTITLGNTSSCVIGGFCAYHNSTSGTFASHRLYYGVHPDVQPPSLCSQGCGAGSLFDIATNVTSHELTEAVTDADVGPANALARPLAWIDPVHSEIGDLCVGREGTITANGTSYTVQLEFSNFQNDCAVVPPTFITTFPFNSNATAGIEFNQGIELATGGVSTFQGIYTGTVHFTSSDPQAILPADYTFNVADNAVHAFVFTLKTPGLQTITVTDTQRGAVTGTFNVFVTSPPAAQFRVSAPSHATPAVPITIAVAAVDANGAPATSYTGPVHFSSSDPAAVLPADTALVNGRGTFSITFNTASNAGQTLNIADVPTGRPFIQVGFSVLANSPNSTSTTISASASTVTFGQPVVFTAQVTGGSTAFLGTPVSFSENGFSVVFGGVDPTGHAQASAILTGGTHVIFAEFSGDSFHNSSSSPTPVIVNVNPASATLAVTSSTNPSVFGGPVTFTVTETSPAQGAIPGFLDTGGLITVFDGATPMAVLPATVVGNSASFVANSLTPGTHAITAQSSGSRNFAPATSAALQQTINPGPPTNYTLTLTRSALTVQAGQSARYAITIGSISFFTGSVKFNCSGNLPPLTTCLFSSKTGGVTATQNGLILLDVKTTGPNTGLVSSSTPPSIFRRLQWTLAPFMGIVVLTGLCGKRRKHVLLLMLTFLLIAGITSCGGGGGGSTVTTTPPPTPTPPPSTPAGTYTITVNAVGAATLGSNPATPSQQLTMTLTVQ